MNKNFENFKEFLKNVKSVNFSVIVYYVATQCPFRPRQQKFSLKKFLLFFPKKPALKKFLIFSQKAFNFLGTETPKKSLYFRKQNFLIFHERYIQNPSIFRTRSIFRTMAYLKPEGYSELPNIYMKCSAKQLPSVLSGLKRFS